MRDEAAVRIVAITARNQPFIYTMMERFGKVGFSLQMTGETELRLRRFQQLLAHFGGMNGVAVIATNVVLDVLRAKKIRVFLAELVAGQATLG
jgi:hypothetical protein